jgi:hypothetical protein
VRISFKGSIAIKDCIEENGAELEPEKETQFSYGIRGPSRLYVLM